MAKSKSKLETFFRITPREDAREWAEDMWDTYGFDYFIDWTTSRTVFAWALDTDEDLAKALKRDNISFTTEKLDPDVVFK